MGKQVFGYIRVSGQGQIEKDGPERQKQAIDAFCARHNLELLGTFFEAGVSGTKDCMERPEFARLAETRSGDQGIVVERLDRFARELMVQEVMLHKCQNLGIPVYATDYSELVDVCAVTDDPSRKLVRQIMGTIAEYEKSNMVLRTRAARVRQRELNGRCEGRKPYGFTECEKATMEIMLEHFDDNGSFAATAEHLNEVGLKTRTGLPWRRQTVKKIIDRHATKSPAIDCSL